MSKYEIIIYWSEEDQVNLRIELETTTKWKKYALASLAAAASIRCRN